MFPLMTLLGARRKTMAVAKIAISYMPGPLYHGASNSRKRGRLQK
jgi:hypothetical protein